MSNFTVTAEIARRLNVAPRYISDLFYQRKIDAGRAPVVAGRRMIPVDLVPAIIEQLRAAGRLGADVVESLPPQSQGVAGGQ